MNCLLASLVLVIYPAGPLAQALVLIFRPSIDYVHPDWLFPRLPTKHPDNLNDYAKTP